MCRDFLIWCRVADLGASLSHSQHFFVIIQTSAVFCFSLFKTIWKLLEIEFFFFLSTPSLQELLLFSWKSLSKLPEKKSCVFFLLLDLKIWIWRGKHEVSHIPGGFCFEEKNFYSLVQLQREFNGWLNNFISNSYYEENKKKTCRCCRWRESALIISCWFSCYPPAIWPPRCPNHRRDAEVKYI